MDIMTPAERSKRMSLIRSSDTKPELRVRRILHSLSYRYLLHRRDLPGVPDLVFPSRKKVIFVHGCFWHAHQHCIVANRPKTRRSFWDAKFKHNKERDKANRTLLKKMGWKVCTIWECETKNDDYLVSRLSHFLGPIKSKISKVGGYRG